MSRLTLTTSVLAILAASAATARDQVQVAGSSTVLPYATIVAELFGENFDFPTPVIESGGSSAGLKKFCEGVGENTIDIANASRRIKEAEIAACKAAGVSDIIEVRIGYDGIVFASDIDGESFAFTPADWYKALAAEVVRDGELAPNTATLWSEVNADLPAQEIMAFVPGTKHGTREVFDIKVIEQGCKDSGASAELESLGMDADKLCTSLRTDGRAVEIDGDYTETLTRIGSNPDGIGVFGLSFYENNTAELQVATMNGVVPSAETIASGEYPVSRPLYFYAKQAHFDMTPGLKEFAEFFVSDDIAGAGGPLADYGLVPDPDLAETQAGLAEEALMN
ncbi:phosphonate ABC transporter substrate-binding protein [Roseovarius spongiae]|uniref:Phosphonate ABC transporter substrate-binding protein n=1 Tax=Roseovarius spongiae TaxID=2320272 RepID=A0A3A8BBD6_9RHOB|nr:substrate-binding domain-containing protein [Roseovarius spongiae]RKF16704.1 phosphonate ABC transporter substrate-binding protein [Roseovarius spongiae]